MRSVKYSRLPTDDCGDESAINMSDGDTFNFSSAFKYTQDNSVPRYGSAFSYANVKSRNDIPLADVESHPSMVGKVFGPIITILSYLLMIMTFPISAWFVFKLVKGHERMVVFRVGKLKRVKGPGISLVLPCIDRITRVDVRTKAFSVPPNKAMSSDGATIEIGAEVYYQVCDPVKSVSSIQDFASSTRSLCQLALQKSMARYSLLQVQGEQTLIGTTLKNELNITTADWGIAITKIQLSPVKVIQEPNALLEGCNLANAPLDCLGPMLFPAGSTQLPVQGLKERGLLPPGQANDAITTVLNQVVGSLAAQAAQRRTPSAVATLGAAATAGPSTAGPSTAMVMPSTSAATAPGAAPKRHSFTPREFLQIVQPHLTAELVNQVKAVFLFRVSGEEGGDFFLDLKNDTGSAGEGLPPGGAPNVTLSLCHSDLEKVFLGEMSAFQAYVGGRLKVDGDLQSAMALQAVIEAIQTASPS